MKNTQKITHTFEKNQAKNSGKNNEENQSQEKKIENRRKVLLKC